MRFFLVALFLFTTQSALAIPSATTEQCAMWAKKVEEYTEKQHQRAPLEKRVFYFNEAEAYEIRLRAGRCGSRETESK